MFKQSNSFTRGLALVVSLALVACGQPSGESVSTSSEAAALKIVGLDGVERDVAYGALVEAADGVRWATQVDGADYTVDVHLDARGDVITVTGPEGRTLFEARHADEIHYTGWVGDRLAPFERTVTLPDAESAPAQQTREVGSALGLAGTDGFFAPLSEAGNEVAAPLALAVFPAVLDRALGNSNGPLSTEDGYASLEQAIWPALGVLVAAAGLGATLGAGYCHRSSTSASCTASNGVGSSVTCNACQGQATCVQVAVSGDDIAIVLGADDDDDDAYTCSCYCPGG